MMTKPSDMFSDSVFEERLRLKREAVLLALYDSSYRPIMKRRECACFSPFFTDLKHLWEWEASHDKARYWLPKWLYIGNPNEIWQFNKYQEAYYQFILNYPAWKGLIKDTKGRWFKIAADECDVTTLGGLSYAIRGLWAVNEHVPRSYYLLSKYTDLPEAVCFLIAINRRPSKPIEGINKLIFFDPGHNVTHSTFRLREVRKFLSGKGNPSSMKWSEARQWGRVGPTTPRSFFTTQSVSNSFRLGYGSVTKENVDDWLNNVSNMLL